MRYVEYRVANRSSVAAMSSTNPAYRSRKPWRNTPGHGATREQTALVRALETKSGREEHDLKGMTRADVSDYIFQLQRKTRVRTPLSTKTSATPKRIGKQKFRPPKTSST